MPLEQVQKFLRHKRIATTQIYAETSVRAVGENYSISRSSTQKNLSSGAEQFVLLKSFHLIIPRNTI